jgi:hypothetical protein
MRALLVLIPAALVVGYIVDAVADRHHEPHPEALVVEVKAGSHAVATAEAVSSAEAVGIGISQDVSLDLDLDWVEDLVQSLGHDLEELDAQAIKISGSADASMKASLEAALEVLQAELERAEFDRDEAAARISVAGSVLASIAASLEGKLQIETDEGSFLLITTPDGIRLIER